MPEITILVVEDHDILREGLKILLETEGFRVLTAIHGQDALQKMEFTTPHLILSDITMPVMDGYDFYQQVRLRSQWVTIPFIFLTAHGEREKVFASKKMGVEDYLVKPVERQELIAAIRSRLERSQQLMLVQMQQSYEASLIMLANAIELRDQYTRGHVERVMSYSLAIAGLMGLTSVQMQSVRYGSILHDIGKIYVHEEILKKAGSLDVDEWMEMKHHPLKGAELLQRIPYLAPAIAVIRHHHERWDGSGYPDGLKGEEIPLAARIIAVADAFDAMTTTRVYQEPVTHRQALRRIQADSGTWFDPRVVEALREIIEKSEGTAEN